MIYKIDTKLNDLEIETPLDENIFHSKFINEFKEFQEKTINGVLDVDKEKIILEDQKLCDLFDELHEIEVEEDEDEKVKKEEIISPDEINNLKIIDTLKTKINWTYPELESIGIDLNNLHYKFRFKGYVFQKRFWSKEYTIVDKP